MPRPKFDPFGLDRILGPPPALDGRDLEEFYGLYQLLCDDLKPQGLSEHIEVRFCAEKLLEMQDLKGRIVDLIASAEFASLLSLLPPAGRYEDLETAKSFYSEHSQTREKAEAYVRRLKITRAQIRAHAIHLRHETLALLERMISEREIAWRRTSKYFRKMGQKAPRQDADRTARKVVGFSQSKGQRE